MKKTKSAILSLVLIFVFLMIPVITTATSDNSTPPTAKAGNTEAGITPASLPATYKSPDGN